MYFFTSSSFLYSSHSPPSPLYPFSFFPLLILSPPPYSPSTSPFLLLLLPFQLSMFASVDSTQTPVIGPDIFVMYTLYNHLQGVQETHRTFLWRNTMYNVQPSTECPRRKHRTYLCCLLSTTISRVSKKTQNIFVMYSLYNHMQGVHAGKHRVSEKKQNKLVMYTLYNVQPSTGCSRKHMTCLWCNTLYNYLQDVRV